MNDLSRPPVRLLLVDDHAVVRAGLCALLGGEPGFAVVGETGDGGDGVHLAERLRPDVVLMDLRLSDTFPGSDGVDITRRLLATVPTTRVVMLTSYSGQRDVLRAMEAGASGYVLKAGPPEELLRAIRAAVAGGMGLAPEAATHLVGRVSGLQQTFSEREIEVLRLLAHGNSNRAIAKALFLAESTVKTHLVRISCKLGTDNRVATVKEALRLGLVELDGLL